MAMADMTRDELLKSMMDAAQGSETTDDSWREVCDDILAALNAAGLAVVPKEATKEMVKVTSSFGTPAVDRWRINAANSTGNILEK